MVSRPKLWIDAGDVRRGAAASALLSFGDVVDEGLEAAERRWRACVRVAADALGAAGEQQLEVLAGVGVERGEEGVGLMFGSV